MIIDTNGFEIGDEVWWVDREFYDIKPSSFIIFGFAILKDEIFALPIGNEFVDINIDCLYTNEQDCQLACDKLNGINHN